jgi:hypothetical protein
MDIKLQFYEPLIEKVADHIPICSNRQFLSLFQSIIMVGRPALGTYIFNIALNSFVGRMKSLEDREKLFKKLDEN